MSGRDESWSQTENGMKDEDSESDNVTDTSELVNVESQLIYTKDNNCYSVESYNYSLSGNNLIGDEWSGTEDGGLHITRFPKSPERAY